MMEKKISTTRQKKMKGCTYSYLNDGFEDFDENVSQVVQKVQHDDNVQDQQRPKFEDHAAQNLDMKNFEVGNSNNKPDSSHGGASGHRKAWLIPENEIIETSAEKLDISDQEIGIDEEREFYNMTCNSKNEDGEEIDRFPIHRANSDSCNPQFEVGMVFKTKDDLRAAIVNYGVQIGRPLFFKKNDQVRL